jgi:hypothetical protein
MLNFPDAGWSRRGLLPQPLCLPGGILVCVVIAASSCTA